MPDQKTEHQLEIEFLKEMSLMRGLTDSQLEFLRHFLVREVYPPNQVIIREGDLTSDLFLILDGEVSVIKWDEERHFQMPIVRLVKRDMFGEMSFMDDSPRSSTVKTIKETTVFKLSRKALASSSIEMRDIENTMFANIAVVNIHRLRETNRLFVKNLRTNLQILQERHDIGTFLIYQLLLFAICSFIGTFFDDRLRAYIPWLLVALPSYYMFRKNTFIYSRYEWNFAKWPKIIGISLAISFVILAFDFFLRSVFQLNAAERWMLNFRPEFNIPLPIFSLAFNVIFYAVYCFAFEFMARDVLQSSVQEFCNDENGYQTIWMNASLLFLLQLPLGDIPALYTFLSSLFLGFVYLKQKTILGVFIIHFLVGLFFANF